MLTVFGNKTIVERTLNLIVKISFVEFSHVFCAANKKKNFNKSAKHTKIRPKTFY